jgi:D-alanyl-D-alanine carboxypeptidase
LSPVRQLLSHTAGVRPDWFPPTAVPNLLAPVTREQTIKGLNSGQLLDSPLGTKWSYSNAGFMLLGLAIESITGMSYADFIHTEFALPLGLLDTGVCGTSSLAVPEGYGLVNGTWIRLPSLHNTVVWSSGSLCSTASDLARWSHLLATGQVMLPDSYATMITPARLANNTIVPNRYAFGVLAQSLLGHPIVWHDGAIDGFQSHLVYLSDQDIAIGVVTNGFPRPGERQPVPHRGGRRESRAGRAVAMAGAPMNHSATRRRGSGEGFGPDPCARCGWKTTASPGSSGISVRRLSSNTPALVSDVS